MAKKQHSKDVMLPHSAAKVKFYKTYLDLYLRILSNSPYIKTINIYDVFCGRGIYKNGGIGSPIEAANVIREVIKQFDSKSEINLFINDKNTKYVNNVRKYIFSEHNENPKTLTPFFSSIDGVDFLDNLSQTINSTDTSTRNLIFIDPYGYKEIKKETIIRLLSNGKTEVMIFLPISIMNRFTSHALNHEDEAMFKPLSDFVKSFFPATHPMVMDAKISNMEYISFLTNAFRFGGKYYSTSYHIERSSNNYFALFFITPSEYGYEKILETRWKLDSIDGNGFELPKQATLFDEIDIENKKQEVFDKLYQSTLKFLSCGKRTNQDLYTFTLSSEYLPKHMMQVLSLLKSQGRLNVQEATPAKPCAAGAFYLHRKDGERIIVSLKK